MRFFCGSPFLNTYTQQQNVELLAEFQGFSAEIVLRIQVVCKQEKKKVIR